MRVELIISVALLPGEIDSDAEQDAEESEDDIGMFVFGLLRTLLTFGYAQCYQAGTRRMIFLCPKTTTTWTIYPCHRDRHLGQ